MRNARTFTRKFPDTEATEIDLTAPEAAHPEQWEPHLDGVCAVINAAGVLQPAKDRDAWAVHHDAPIALYKACVHTGVRQIVLVSAVGVEEGTTTFALSKRAGERTLETSTVPWTIVRPAVVVGRGSYGGTSLLRALAACPVRTPVPGDGAMALNTIHTDDLAEGIVRLLRTRHAHGKVMDAAAPERHTLREALALYRRWLGLPTQRTVRIPMAIAKMIARTADAMRLAPITSTTLAQVRTRLEGDGTQFTNTTGVTPRTLIQGLAEQPAQSQDLWHARLFLARPLIRTTLAALWAGSGAVALASARAQAEAHTLLGGHPWTSGVLGATALIDIAVGLAVARGWRPRAMTTVQLTLIGLYTAALTIAAPSLWTELTGGLAKNLAMAMLVLIARITEEER